MTEVDVLKKAWLTVLGVGEVQPDQNFFDLGGDSLDAIEMLTIYEAESGAEFPLEALFSDGSYAAAERAVAKATSAP